MENFFSVRKFQVAVLGLLTTIAMSGSNTAIAQPSDDNTASRGGDVSTPSRPNAGLRQYACRYLSPEERLTLQVCDVRIVRVRGNQVTFTFRTTKPATYIIGYSEALEDGGINYNNGNFEGGATVPATRHRQTVTFPTTVMQKYHLTIQAQTPPSETAPIEFDDFGSNWASPNATEVFAVWTRRVRSAGF